jgi:hypothetical protein
MRSRREISRPQPVRRGRQWTRSLSTGTHVSPIEWNIIVLYGRYILEAGPPVPARKIGRLSV